MYHILCIQISLLRWHVFYPESALWIYNSHFHHKCRSGIPFCHLTNSFLQILISTDEISKNRFLMQTRSYHNFSDLHLTVLLHQSNQPDIFLLCFLLFFLYFHDVLMHIRLLFSYLYPFYPLNKRIIPSFVSL